MKVDIATLDEYVKNKLVRTQKHPTLPLKIINYTETTQFYRKWDDFTSMCRGLVIDADGKIVARSFQKFHNIEENMHVPTDEFVVYEKLDGSLIMLFYYRDNWIVASRGSFTSEQSKKAVSLLKNHNIALNEDLTYVFEIIYPENRIVVNYHGEEKLVYLASFEKDGTERLDQEYVVKACGFETVPRYNFDDYAHIQTLNWQNREGFVVRFTNGERVKIKFQNYVDLHRVVTHLDDHKIWTWYDAYESVDDVAMLVPDEWHNWLLQKWQCLDTKCKRLLKEAQTFVDANRDCSAREFAAIAKTRPDRSIVFDIRAGKECKAHTLALVKQMFGKELDTSKITQDSNLPKAYIFDVDGTLAISEDRDAYDWSRVVEDKVNNPVKNCAVALKSAGYRIIVVSARDAACFTETEKWLDDNEIPHDELHLRPRGDKRPDYQIKEGIWRSICSTFL